MKSQAFGIVCERTISGVKLVNPRVGISRCSWSNRGLSSKNMAKTYDRPPVKCQHLRYFLYALPRTARECISRIRQQVPRAFGGTFNELVYSSN